MTPPRTRDAEATRTAILEAAERIFVEKGPAKTSMSEIAKAAGVTKSLIHHHFGSKEGLWMAVKGYRFQLYADRQRPQLEQPGSSAALLRESMEAYFHFLRDHPDFVRFMSWMHLERETPESFDQGDSLFRLGVEKIREAQQNGQLRDDLQPFFILIAMVGCITHWFQDCQSHHGWVDPDHPEREDELFLSHLMTMFFEGLEPRDPA